jgi:hypothetical protein
MTETEFIAAAERLETMHKQFANLVLMLIGSFQKLETYLESYSTSFEANLNSYHKTTEVLSSYNDFLRELKAGMEAVVRIAGENNVSITESNAQMKELMSKFDSYFGDAAGLEHEN